MPDQHEQYRAYWLGSEGASECSLTSHELGMLERSVKFFTSRPKVYRSTAVTRDQFYGLLTEGLGRAFTLEPHLKAPVSARVHAEAAKLVDAYDLGWFGQALWHNLAGPGESIEASELVQGLVQLACGNDRHWHRFILQILGSTGGRVAHTVINSVVQQLHLLLCESAIWSLRHQKGATTDSELLARIDYCSLAATQLFESAAPIVEPGDYSLKELLKLPNVDGLLFYIQQMLLATVGGRSSAPTWHYDEPVVVEPSPEPTPEPSPEPVAEQMATEEPLVAPQNCVSYRQRRGSRQKPTTIPQPEMPEFSFGVVPQVCCTSLGAVVEEVHHVSANRNVGALNGFEVAALRGWQSEQVRYYSLTPHKNWRVLVLDVDDICRMLGWAEGYAAGPSQLLWLAEELQQAQECDQQILVVCHSPIEQGLSTGLKRQNHKQLQRCLLKSPAVRAVLSASDGGTDDTVRRFFDENGV